MFKPPKLFLCFDQCDQIRLFAEGLGEKNFFQKYVAQIFEDFWPFLKTVDFQHKILWIFLAICSKNWATFLFRTSGYTGFD